MIKNVFIQDDHFDKKIFFNMIKKYFDQDQKNIFLILIKIFFYHIEKYFFIKMIILNKNIFDHDQKKILIKISLFISIF